MSRIPKFKVWIPYNKMMMRPKYIIEIQESQVSGVTIGQMKQWVWLEYTRRNDKNGVEIYEGDVVKHIRMVYNLDDPLNDQAYPKEEISFIEYRGNGFWVHEESFGWEGEGLWDWDTLEVIGNIYQNPELLQK